MKISVVSGKTNAGKKNSIIYLILSVMGVQIADAMPQAQVYSDGAMYQFDAQTLDSVSDYEVQPRNLALSRFGGWRAQRLDSGTGFFRVEKINGRWWAVDPEGYLFVFKALNSVNLTNYSQSEIYQILRQYGFNGMGNWSDENILSSSLQQTTPLAYCPHLSFITEYRRNRENGLPRIDFPVWDDGFETYANAAAAAFCQPYVNDPAVFGYFSDNEILWKEAFTNHLSLSSDDPNYIALTGFLAARGKSTNDWDQTDKDAYVAELGERYYSVVSSALKSADTNHMYIGTRCNSTERYNQAFMENAGKCLDIFSSNHYHRWDLRQMETRNMAEWSGRPLLLSEFYAAEGGVTGAGWIVNAQEDRGLFYENFVSSMLGNRSIVGFNWFKFQDDEYGNKGIVNTNGQLYAELLGHMAKLNGKIYDYVDCVDSREAADLILTPEADAYFLGTTNEGSAPELWVKNATVYRETYIRFNLSPVKNIGIESAYICLSSVETSGALAGEYEVDLIADDTWGEMTINMNNAPTGSTILKTFENGASDLVIDVSDVITNELSDGKLSVRIKANLNNGNIPKYASRENTNITARPVLKINYTGMTTFDFTDDSEFDGSGIGTHKTLRDPELGIDVTLTTCDVIGNDGTLASNGNDHKTNITGSLNAMGINSAGADFPENFEPGEGWVFSFNVDVLLSTIDLDNQNSGDELTISAADISDIVLVDGQPGNVHDLGNVLIAAGTPVTVRVTSATGAIRIRGLSVYALPTPVTFDFTDGSEFDGGGVCAYRTLQDPGLGIDVTLTTCDVIGNDGTLASDGNDHKTNVSGSLNAMGINSAGVDSPENFEPGEGWVFSFNVDVLLSTIDLDSQDAGDELTISATNISDIVLSDGQSGDVHDLGDALIVAGTPVTIRTTSATGTIRIRSLSVYALPTPVTFDFADGSEFDGGGAGAYRTQQDPDTGIDVTLTTCDILGNDGTLASDGNDHTTNISGALNALGINSVGTDSSGNFEPGEGWEFSFNVDVVLSEIDLDSQDAESELTVSSAAFADVVLADGNTDDIHILNTYVPANTKVMIKMTSPVTAADTAVRIKNLSVFPVPAP